MRTKRIISALILPLLLLFTNHIVFEVQAADINGGTAKDTIENLKQADVKKDVSEALKRGDMRFIGIIGFGLSAPVVDEEQSRVGSPDYRAIYGVKIIQGTSDMIFTEEDRILNDLALQYAKNYNRLLLDAIKGTMK